VQLTAYITVNAPLDAQRSSRSTFAAFLPLPYPAAVRRF
jgi:hypothetical protein